MKPSPSGTGLFQAHCSKCDRLLITHSKVVDLCIACYREESK
jgi:formylmethanofuran dehydrogenase subunit E